MAKEGVCPICDVKQQCTVVNVSQWDSWIQGKNCWRVKRKGRMHPKWLFKLQTEAQGWVLTARGREQWLSSKHQRHENLLMCVRVQLHVWACVAWRVWALVCTDAQAITLYHLLISRAHIHLSFSLPACGTALHSRMLINKDTHRLVVICFLLKLTLCFWLPKDN